MPILLFSYGTLQKEKVQLELFGRLLSGQKDVLPGYKLESIEIKDQTTLILSEQQFHLIAFKSNNKNDKIEGTVFEITHEELLKADEYEVKDYKRINEVLESGKQAWVYVLNTLF